MADKKVKEKNNKKDSKDQVAVDSSQLTPLLSEKSYRLANELNKYIFIVPPGINKIEIGKLVAEVYKVEVTSVNMITRPGKSIKDWNRNKLYRRSDIKKAVVTLKDGDKIDEFFNI